MPLTLIVGPIKSGKSLELIARVAPHEFANKRVLFVQPHRNVRDEGIASRLGIDVTARRTKTLSEVKDDWDVIGIDEVHMLPIKDAEQINEWLRAGKEVVVSGLDLDYRGKIMPMAKRLLEIKPDTIIYKVSVCEVCHEYNALFTQIISKGKPLTRGLPAVVPEDGTYIYEARCRDCFVRK